MEKDSPSNYDPNLHPNPNSSSLERYNLPPNFHQFSLPPNYLQLLAGPQQFLNHSQFSNSSHILNPSVVHQNTNQQHFSIAQQFNAQNGGGQIPHSIPSLEVTTQGLDIVNLSIQPEVENEDESSKPKRQAYTIEESTLLATCWVDISVDSIVGNDQKLEKMWSRITEVYNKKRSKGTPARKTQTLKSHFQKIQKESRTFSDCYSECYAMWPSGFSDADIMGRAHAEFRKRSGDRSFKYEKVWEVLRENPKFAQVDGDNHLPKRSKTSNSGSYNTTGTPESVISEHVQARPEGQKAAKRKEREKGKAKQPVTSYDPVAESFITTNQKISEMMTSVAMKNDYNIVTRNTSKMEPEQRTFHNNLCEQLKKKWGWT